MEDNIFSFAKISIITIGGYIGAKLGILAPILYTLIIISITDYITGFIASAITGKLSSKTGFKGILKKLCYFIAVGVAVALDWLIYTCSNELGIALTANAYLGCLVAVWLILNESLSIIENLDRAGIPLPPFLKSTLNSVIETVESFSNPKK